MLVTVTITVNCSLEVLVLASVGDIALDMEGTSDGAILLVGIVVLSSTISVVLWWTQLSLYWIQLAL